jgi:hypothetical protein
VCNTLSLPDALPIYFHCIPVPERVASLLLRTEVSLT